MRYIHQILILSILATSFLSCEEATGDSNLLQANDLKNSIFYVKESIDQFSNDNNSTSFFIYNIETGETIKLPIELIGNSPTFLWISPTLYYTQSNIFKSYNLLTKKIKNHILTPPGAGALSISRNQSLLAYKNTNQIFIVDLVTNQTIDTLENQPAFNLRWSPIANHLLIQSIPSLIYDVENKTILTIFQNTTPQFEAWRSDGRQLFYKLEKGNSAPYVLHEIANNVISEIPTAETFEIHNGKFSSDGKNFGYFHTPRNYISDFHHLNTVTNKDVVISVDTTLITNFVWFSKTEDKVLLSDYYSLFIYSLSENNVEKVINVVDPNTDPHTFIISMSILE